MKIVVNTPSGRTGRVVADRLLNAQENVVIISREPTEVEDLILLSLA
jgi:Trk K+ transport system NAD-binding subunit